eukprot:scaffold2357_cov399-Prasinococcus_capsulatus_cf.AAC.5
MKRLCSVIFCPFAQRAVCTREAPAALLRIAALTLARAGASGVRGRPLPPATARALRRLLASTGQLQHPFWCGHGAGAFYKSTARVRGRGRLRRRPGFVQGDRA